MRIVLDINREAIIHFLKSGLIKSVLFTYSWFIHEGEILGYILAVFHILVSTSVFLFIIVCHTIYPAFWLQVVVFVCLFLIWLQHITLNVCVVILAEQGLTSNVSPFVELIKTFLEPYNISVEQFGIYFMIVETTGVAAFALELISRMSFYAQRYFLQNYALKVL
jgi:hypothetical protein